MDNTVKMNADQKAALRRLETAFKACAAAGVKFFGMDNDLHFTVDYDPKQDFHEQYQSGDKEYGNVNTHKTYIDSGGW